MGLGLVGAISAPASPLLGRRIAAAGARDRGAVPPGRVLPVPLARPPGRSRSPASACGCSSPPQFRLVRVAAAMYARRLRRRLPRADPARRNLTLFGTYAAGPVLLALVPLRRGGGSPSPRCCSTGSGRRRSTPSSWSSDDPSVEQAYYAPPSGHLGVRRLREPPDGDRADGAPIDWETAFVAARYPIALGWERQLDIRFNRLFYDDDLTAAEVPRPGSSTRGSTAWPSPTPRSTTPGWTRPRSIEAGPAVPAAGVG